MTFLEIVQKQGFKSINEYLAAWENAFANCSDFTSQELASIRSAESATEAVVIGAA